jgi:hypothetical protein
MTKAFYQDIVKMIDEDMPVDRRKELLEWYDRYLFILVCHSLRAHFALVACSRRIISQKHLPMAVVWQLECVLK